MGGTDIADECSCADPTRGQPGFESEPLSDLYRQAQTALVAVRLTALGARAGLVCRLTGLEKKVANRLYRQLHGKPSPPGLMPFTDTWFAHDRRRLLQAAVIWKLYARITSLEPDEARALISVYEGYLAIVNEPLLNLTRAFCVSRLVLTRSWQARECAACCTRFVAPVGGGSTLCPGCERYYRFRCRRCGAPLDVKPKGRHRVRCNACR